MSPDFLRKVLPLVLAVVLVYTLFKRAGPHPRATFFGWTRATHGAGIGLVIGFYDGFFGPGTGSFLVFLFVRVLGYDFLSASAAAKLVNTATNIAALGLFVAKGHIWWHFVVVMAVANVLGSLLGPVWRSNMAPGFVRGVFLLVVTALILKTS